MVLKKEGPGVAKAGDIEGGADIESSTPITSSARRSGASIRLEFTTSTGKGHVPAERNRPDHAPIGFIPVDSLYSPVEGVVPRGEHPRGPDPRRRQRTMEIETDGRCAQDTVVLAARIVEDQLSGSDNFEEPKQG